MSMFAYTVFSFRLSKCVCLKTSFGNERKRTAGEGEEEGEGKKGRRGRKRKRKKGKKKKKRRRRKEKCLISLKFESFVLMIKWLPDLTLSRQYKDRAGGERERGERKEGQGSFVGDRECLGGILNF